MLCAKCGADVGDTVRLCDKCTAERQAGGSSDAGPGQKLGMTLTTNERLQRAQERQQEKLLAQKAPREHSPEDAISFFRTPVGKMIGSLALLLVLSAIGFILICLYTKRNPGELFSDLRAHFLLTPMLGTIRLRGIV